MGFFFLADGEENTEEKRPAVGLVDVCLCFFFLFCFRAPIGFSSFSNFSKLDSYFIRCSLIFSEYLDWASSLELVELVDRFCL